MIKLVVSDLDGTLLPHEKENIDEETINIINKILEKNIYFAIASGRSYRELSYFIRKNKHNIFLISENGSLITYKGKILTKRTIEKNKVISLANEIEEHGYDCLIFGVHTLYTTSKNKAYIDYLNKTKGHVIKISKGEDLPEDPLRISVYKSAEKNINKAWIIRNMQKFNVSYDGKEWLDFIELGVNKGSAIQEIKKNFLNEGDEIMAFGDEFNDMEMLKMADYSFAMRNGVKEIIEICSCVTDKPIKTIKKYINLG